MRERGTVTPGASPAPREKRDERTAQVKLQVRLEAK